MSIGNAEVRNAEWKGYTIVNCRVPRFVRFLLYALLVCVNVECWCQPVEGLLDLVLQGIKANEERVVNVYCRFTERLTYVDPMFVKEATQDSKFASDRVCPPFCETSILIDGARYIYTHQEFDGQDHVILDAKDAFDGGIARKYALQLSLEPGTSELSKGGIIDRGPAHLTAMQSVLYATHKDVLGIGKTTSKLISENTTVTRVARKKSKEGEDIFVISIGSPQGEETLFELEVDPAKDFSLVMARQALPGDSSKNWTRYRTLEYKTRDGIWYPSRIEHEEYLRLTSGELYHSRTVLLEVVEAAFNKQYSDPSTFRFEYPAGTLVVDKVVERTYVAGALGKDIAEAVDMKVQRFNEQPSSSRTDTPLSTSLETQPRDTDGTRPELISSERAVNSPATDSKVAYYITTFALLGGSAAVLTYLRRRKSKRAQ